MDKPTYYRWAYSPLSADVDLSHNGEGHPAAIGYHGAMAAARNEPGLVHGYAYRIGGGWRLTDWDSRPVEDPFVVSQVVAALRQREGARQPAGPLLEPDWTDAGGVDWDRQHYGLPLPK